MDNNYEEIYDQAGFFAELWDKLPDNGQPVSPWGTALTSYKMVFLDFSEDIQPCIICSKSSVNGIYEDCLSKNEK